MQLRQAIAIVQKMGQNYGFTVIVVGGALVRLIGPKTKIKKIDKTNKIIYLEKAENPDSKRKEDAKTTVDIDCIAFSNEDDPFVKDVYVAFAKLAKALRYLQKDIAFPAISLEPVLYHPYFPKPNSMLQFVSSIESYHDHDFFFRLGKIKQDVKSASLAYWTYNLVDTNEQFVSLNPLALQLRYSVRGFSIKPKDKEKIWGEKSVFARFVADFSKQTKKEYEKDFLEWHAFIDAVQASTKPTMAIKRGLWNIYWQTIGTYLAHGTGPLGKLLLPLGNTIFAGK